MKTIILMTLLLLTFAQEKCAPLGSGDETQRPVTPEARVPGIIDYGDDRTRDVVNAPSSVRPGQDFQVTITTFGGGCEREGETSVITTETGASVMVYDFTSATRPGVVCTMILKRMPHRVTLNFSKPGEKLIQVWGRRVGADAPPIGAPTVLEHRVMVGTSETSRIPDPVAPDVPWVVTEKGIGPVRIGMTVVEAGQAVGGDLTVLNATASCYYVKPTRRISGVAFMVVDGRIARVDVENQSIATEAGARIGDSEARIKRLYPQVEVTPHKYARGHYLTAMPAGEYRIVFETDGARVTRYRAGRMPEVKWIEGCS